MTTDKSGNQVFNERLDKLIAELPEGYERSALILQRLTHDDWLAWMASHTDGKNGGGQAVCGAMALYIGGLITEVAVNLAKKPEHKQKVAAMILKETVENVRAHLDAFDAGDIIACGVGVKLKDIKN